MKRLALAAVVLTVSAGAGAIALQQAAIAQIEGRLQQAGMTWESRTERLTSLQWSTISGNGAAFDTLTVRAGWPITAKLSRGTLNLAPLASRDAQPAATSRSSSSGGQPQWRPRWQLDCEGIDIEWNGESLLKGLSGQAYPQLLLANAATQITGQWNPEASTRISGAVEGDLPHDALHGRGTLSFTLGDPVSFTLDAPQAQIEHGFLANERLPKTPLTARGEWSPQTGEAIIEGQYGAVAWSATGQAKSGTIDMDVRVALTPLRSIVALFGDGIPETARTQITGEVSLEGNIEGPPWSWRIEPGAKNLSAAGALPADYLGPIIRWTTPGRETVKRCSKGARAPGSEPDCTWEPIQIPHITGPRTPDWIAHHKAGWMPEAVIAAEDIRFRSHDGFDLVAIQEALADAGSDERLRGGSTITQQLAKNLFLDGRRTLERKLRELLFAMSLEERMTKDAILTLYLNVVEFGPGIWGIKDASDAWFLKSPDQLTAREAAFLASILPAPNMWHRRISESGRVPISRVNGVLDRMRRRGSLTKAQHRRARAETLRVVPPAKRD